MNRIEKLEKWITSIIFFVIPVLAFAIMFLAYKGIIGGGELTKLFAGWGLNLLIFLLFIKPLCVIVKKYLDPKRWGISEFLEYILKGWIQKPILIYIKELVVNLIYGISGFFLKYRRLLGILTFWLIFLHLTLLLISRNKMGIGIFSNIGQTFIWIGYIGLAALFIGFITSNNFSMKLLGSNRKRVQQISYIALIAAMLHGVFRGGGRGDAIILLSIFVIFKFGEWTNIGLKKSELKTDVVVGMKIGEDFKQRKCNPCSYIYDEQLGDPESGIAPGTKWGDVPEGRRCPICGVGKDQFTIIARKDGKVEYIRGKVINRKMLTDNVLELNVEFKESLKIKAGQRIGFVFNDDQGKFIRAYSVTHYENENNVTDCIFTIKLLENGRGGKKLRELKIGDDVQMTGVFGRFVLSGNDNEKVFIATGTGLAPIMNMIKNCSEGTKKTLIFGAQTKKDIFYEDEMKKISNLDYKIFLSREEVEGYEYDRIDLNKFNLNNNMEFYVCGAPPVVKSMLEFLKVKGFKKIYYEEFF